VNTPAARSLSRLSANALCRPCALKAPRRPPPPPPPCPPPAPAIVVRGWIQAYTYSLFAPTGQIDGDPLCARRQMADPCSSVPTLKAKVSPDKARLSRPPSPLPHEPERKHKRQRTESPAAVPGAIPPPPPPPGRGASAAQKLKKKRPATPDDDDRRIKAAGGIAPRLHTQERPVPSAAGAAAGPRPLSLRDLEQHIRVSESEAAAKLGTRLRMPCLLPLPPPLIRVYRWPDLTGRRGAGSFRWIQRKDDIKPSARVAADYPIIQSAWEHLDDEAVRRMTQPRFPLHLGWLQCTDHPACRDGKSHGSSLPELGVFATEAIPQGALIFGHRAVSFTWSCPEKATPGFVQGSLC
jgi:hypothetical protein